MQFHLSSFSFIFLSANIILGTFFANTFNVGEISGSRDGENDRPNNGESKHLRKVGKFVPYYTAQTFQGTIIFTFNLLSSLNVRDRVSHPYQTKG
jgi:hypothetical protein